jgi:hypothetical protein
MAPPDDTEDEEDDEVKTESTSGSEYDIDQELLAEARGRPRR